MDVNKDQWSTQGILLTIPRKGQERLNWVKELRKKEDISCMLEILRNEARAKPILFIMQQESNQCYGFQTIHFLEPLRHNNQNKK